ncbi:MAG: hypothetical protein GY796_09620 [Chloroflexi bacterium]|nr:hypothetical protein [Chloroflexota bacterium]
MMSKQPKTILLANGSVPVCPKDGFPLILIDGSLQCTFESLDNRIGGRSIVDMVRHKEIIYFVFDNDYKLPLLCGCCDGPLHFDDLAQERNHIVGKHLQEMWIEHQHMEDGQAYHELGLGFVVEGDKRGESVTVSFAAVAQIKPPRKVSAPASWKRTRRKKSKKKRRRK